MIFPTEEEVRRCVDVAYDGVNTSKIGPIKLPFLAADGLSAHSQFAIQAFYVVLGSILPKGEQTVRGSVDHTTPKEPWQE